MNRRDQALAGRMLAGDESAFEEFFDGYFPGLYRFALPRVNYNPDDAEEIAQSTLCAAVSKLGTYRAEAALFTWLCTFCRHEISSFYSRRNRQLQTVDLVEESSEVLAALDSLWTMHGEGPEESVRHGEIARLVQVALDRLPPRYGNALEWKYADGLSVKEIAARLGLSPKATESLLTRARQAFRDAFLSLARGRAWSPQAGTTSP